MQWTHNLSHLVCLAAGLLLAVSGFLLRDITAERLTLITEPPGSRARRRRSGFGRRVALVGVGVLAMGYGIWRMMP